MSYRVGIFGASGAVGQEFLELVFARSFPMTSLRLFASARSAGKAVTAPDGSTLTIEEATADSFAELDVALVSVSGSFSQAMAAEAQARGCTFIDNSSAWRMEPGVPLVVPEINADALKGHRGLISNPNCSTIITLMALAPLHRAFGLKRLIATTYQAVSGSGLPGMQELEAQVRAYGAGEEAPAPATYPHPIAFNALPQVDAFFPDGYTKEELKMANESRKILGAPELAISTTCVRVPVMRSHAVAVHAEFAQTPDLEAARAALAAFPGLIVQDDPANSVYPQPLERAGQDDCAVGRLRLDSALENGLALWVVGDQIRKGAALNAVQIAEALHEQGAMGF